MHSYHNHTFYTTSKSSKLYIHVAAVKIICPANPILYPNSHPNPPATVKMSSSHSSHRHHRCKNHRGSAHSSSPFDINSIQFDLGDSGSGRRASRSGPLPSTPRMSWGASPMPHQRRGSMGVYMDGLDGIGMGLGVRGLRTGGA